MAERFIIPLQKKVVNENINFEKTSLHRKFETIQGGPEKTAQTLMCYNFSTAGQRVTRFPA